MGLILWQNFTQAATLLNLCIIFNLFSNLGNVWEEPKYVIY